jgi:single-strand DNA-binding protein
VTEIGLAVNDRRKDSKTGQWVDETTFVDVTFWGRNAEIASEYLSKGSPILLEGRLKLDTWETDGQKRSKLRVVGEMFRMLGGKGGGQGGGGARGQAAAGGGGSEYDDAQYGGGHDEPAPARRSAPARTAAAPPPDDEIPF